MLTAIIIIVAYGILGTALMFMLSDKDPEDNYYRRVIPSVIWCWGPVVLLLLFIIAEDFLER